MDNSPSPLDTLRQLKEMLDAGALTPPEFELLKQRLLFDDDALFAPEAPSVAAPGLPPSVPDVPAAPRPTPADDQAAAALAAAFSPAAAARPAPPESLAMPSAVASAPAGPAPGPEPEVGWAADEFPESEAPPARSPLMLVLSIGGLLALLGLVLYLALNRPPSERISSTSLTAADSTAAPIETGPQAEPLPAVVAAPETVRVTPTNPAPPVQPRPAPVVRDSVAEALPAAPADSATAPD